MEIDFLGLNSTTANRPNNNIDEVEHYGFKQASSTTLTEANLGVVETSLSLSTGHSLYYHREILNFSEKKKGKLTEFSSSSSGGSTATRCSFTGKQSLAFVPPPIYRPSATTTAAGPFYNLKLRKIHEIQAEPASIITMLYDNNAQEKAVPGLSVHARICSTGPGYSTTPTVAMARRATLARFLEKRLHRMNQARKAHLMGKSIYNATNNTYEACDHHHRSVVTRKNNNNNNNNIVKR